MISIYELVISTIEKMGYVIFEKEEDDFNIGDYITDSIIFIEFILELEAVLNMELPEDFLSYDNLFSAKFFSEKLNCHIEQVSNEVTAGSY